jgi:RHH-type proline utilization regulon transcriptional repressor/proline dehydrogenase/delta 1-pyrroline-5-carboxylate dehydrogenase
MTPRHAEQHVELESLIRRFGRELSDRSSGLSPKVFHRGWWSAALLDWSLKEEDFKVRLFRFIDALPSLRTDEQVARLAYEYFGEEAVLPRLVRWGLRAMTGTRIGAFVGARGLRSQIRRMAGTFIAGESIDKALPALEGLWRDGYGCSVDLLGEATVSEVEADRYRDRCVEALSRMAQAAGRWPMQALLEQDHLGPLPRVNLSVKLSALYSQLDAIDPEGSYRAVSARLRPILDLAMSLPAAITFDMEQAELKDVTLVVFMRLLAEPAYRHYPYGGIALQAYLKESASDLEQLLGWLRRRQAPITIRLVKGAYWDSDSVRYRQRGWPLPVFEHKNQTDVNYEALTKTLIAHAADLRPAIGTHNLRHLAHARALAETAGLSPHACEYQMLYGMAEPLQAAVKQAGCRLRLYTPVGDLLPGVAYLVRRLLENTSNESFLRRRYVEALPLDVQLASPETSRDLDGARRPGLPPGQPDLLRVPGFVNEPHADFTKDETRASMTAAIGGVRKQLGGERRSRAAAGVRLSGARLTSRNPSLPGEIIGQVPGADVSDVHEVIQQARRHFDGWSKTRPEHRADILVQAAAVMRRRRYELAAWEILETGKPWREADADVAEAIDFLEFYARELRALARPKRLGHAPGELNVQEIQPRGVAVVISPWNFPLAIPTGMVSAALVTGNVVVFKPSERAPIIGSLLHEAMQEAGLPEGVLSFVPGGPDIGAALVRHPDVQIVAFTGSKMVGLTLLAEAARPGPQQRFIKRVIAEMGGKNAIVIDDTADLDEAVTGVVTSFTGYQGQKCSACSRAIVLDSVHDQFLQRLTESVVSLRIGPPEDPANRVGPMIDERARAKVLEYIEIGKKEGRLVIQRDAPKDGYFVGPAVFADIRPEHRLAREEIFGPVLAVMRARTFEEALQMANDSEYALTGGLYSRRPANILRARDAFDVGNLYINRPITGALVGRQPFGGHRLSGVGSKAGGEDYLQQFVVTRVISENTLRRGFAPSETE